MLEKVLDILKLIVDKDDINPTDKLHEDLGMDSLTFIRMIVLLEKEFNIRIDEKYFEDGVLNNAECIVRCIEECLNNN